MARYLDPKLDPIFKRIFGEHPDILMSFLNATLPLPKGREITELTYLPTEQVPVIPDFKNSIADVKCKDSEGNIFIVEIQMQWTASFTKRLLFGASQAYVRQLGRGEFYDKLAPVIAIGLIDDIFEQDTEQWYHHYQIINKGDSAKTIDEIQLLLIELPKFKAESIIEKKMQVLWLRFLSELNEDITEVPKELLAVPEIEKAVELSEEAAYSKGELAAYDKYWDGIRVQRSYVHDAEKKGKQQGHAEGKAEGLAEGKAEGLAEGIKKGIEKGVLKVAKNLLSIGVPLDDIVKTTQLPLEIVKQLVVKEKID
jgi:predicted transposase/invertase (TIGR01784 family)